MGRRGRAAGSNWSGRTILISARPIVRRGGDGVVGGWAGSLNGRKNIQPRVLPITSVICPSILRPAHARVVMER